SRAAGRIANRRTGSYDKERSDRYRVTKAWPQRVGSGRSSPRSERSTQLCPGLLVLGPAPGPGWHWTILIASTQNADPLAASAPTTRDGHGSPHIGVSKSWRPPLANC